MKCRLFLSVACLLWSIISYCQPVIPRATKGSRPIIHLESVPPSAYESGKIEVKLLPRFKHQMPTLNLEKKVVCTNAAMQQLFDNWQIQDCSLLFGNALAQSEQKKRHEAWGFDRWVTLTMPDQTNIIQAVRAFEASGFFEVVEPVYKAEVIGHVAAAPLNPNDPIYGQQWHLKNTGQSGGTAGKDISIEGAWNIETGKPSVIVSVHDNAINEAHPDLAQNVAVGKSFNFIDKNNTLTLNSSHGSHCGGIIAAVNNNGVNVSSIAGGNGSSNSGVRLMSCETFGPNNKAGGFAESLVYAADKGAAISNNSWGYSEPDLYDISVFDAIDYFCEHGGGTVLQGGVVVFAAGNNGKNWQVFPGAYERVICVAATNNKDIRSNYSNYGSWVDISAPGGEGYFGGGIFSTDNIGYSNSSGTSYACPQVVGVAALVASVLSGKASANDVNDIILSTVDDHYPLNPNFKGQLGAGRLNAFAAVKKASLLATKALNTVTNFKGQAECDKILLNWGNATVGGKVMIAYSPNTNMTMPTDGKVYQKGDTLHDGSVIIYVGTGTTTNYPSLDTLIQYNFKIWTVGTGNVYSLGKNTAVMVHPVFQGGGLGVLEQNFNSPPIFPTKLWHNSNTNLDFDSWVHTTFDTIGVGAGDNYSMCYYNYKYDTILGAVDTLFSPQVTVKGADSILLSLYYAYQYLNKGKSYSDSLEIVVSTDCGATYQSLWKKGGAQLSTVSDTANKAFYPTTIDKWKQIYLDLSSYKNKDRLFVGVRGYNGKGNNLFFDNINLAVRYKTDATIAQVLQPIANGCSKTVAPQVMLKNVGNQSLTACKIGFQIDNGAINSVNFAGLLKRDSSTTLNLPTSMLATGEHALKVFSYLPNNIADANTVNDTLVYRFTITQQQAIPLSENFDGVQFPPIGWEVLQTPKDAFTWQAVPTTKGKSAFMQHYLYANSTNAVDNLLTPIIPINKINDSLYFSFDLAATNRGGTTIPDTMEVALTKDCGNTWTTLYKKWGSTLQTVRPPGVEFVPAATEWRRDTIILNRWVQLNDQVRLRFTNTNNNSNNIYIDNVKCSYATTLPISLLKWSAAINADGTALLFWQTQREVNSHHFQVESSVNGREFAVIATIPAVGSGTNSYQWLDKKHISGIRYYRLKMWDNDGSYQYSKVLQLSGNMDFAIQQVFPNPVKSVANVMMSSPKAQVVQYSITDAIGRSVFGKSETLVKGVNQIMISTENLPSGQYWLFIQNEQGQLIKAPFVK